MLLRGNVPREREGGFLRLQVGKAICVICDEGDLSKECNVFLSETRVEIYLHLRDRPLKCLNIDVSLNLFNTPRVWSRFTIFHNITCNSKT